jgi:hypothetical protein
MRGVVKFYSTKRDLARLSKLWDRMRTYVDVEHGAGPGPGSEEDFLALKREIGQAMVALESDFGSSRLNREAENAGSRIRHFLGQIPTLGSLNEFLTRDQQNLQKSWHAVFLILAELSGARYKLRVGSSPAPATYAASPMSGEPRRRGSSLPMFRFVGSIVRVVMTLVMIVAVLAIVLFLTESAGFFGSRDPNTGAWIAPSNPILGQIGAFWQGFRGWASMNLAFITAPLAGFYAMHPDIAAVLLVAILGIFVGYLIFIRAK